MVSVLVAGVGHVGESLATMLIFHPKVEHVYLFDIDVDKMYGELDDLNAASLQLIQDELFSEWKYEDADYVFICAGHSRDYLVASHESDESLFEKNMPVIKALLDIFPKEKCLIITNPSRMLGEFFKVRYLGDKLDETRKEFGLMNGLEILSLKGFTNCGISAEAWKAIK